jgi:hypothetical protein
MKKCNNFIFGLGLIVLSLLIGSKESLAVPVFARKYHTACSTCHLAFPVRNAFGEAFRNNGYRFPDGKDEDMVKESPIELGSEAQKKAFPDAFYPSDIPNMPSLGFLATTQLDLQKGSNGKFSDWAFGQELGIFFAGTVTDNISYFGDFGVNTEEGATLGRLVLIWAFAPGLNFAVGDVGFPELFTLISAAPNADGGISYATSLPNPNKGVEIRFTGDTGETGGYAIVAGIGRNNTEEAGSLTDSRFIRASYKLFGAGLLSGSGGTYGNQSIGMDNSVTFGVNFFSSDDGATVGDENIHGLTKTAFSGDIMANYGSFRAIAQVARFNEVFEVDSLGVRSNFGKRTQLSLEGDYWVYPWLFGVLRYEHVKDDLNGEITKVIPGVAAMLRVNAKLGFEYIAYTKNSDMNTFNFYAQVGF